MTTTGFLTVEAEMDCLADELDHRAAEYRDQELHAFFAENKSYWQGRAEQAELSAAEIRKVLDETRPRDDGPNYTDLTSFETAEDFEAREARCCDNGET